MIGVAVLYVGAALLFFGFAVAAFATGNPIAIGFAVIYGVGFVALAAGTD